MIHADEVIVIGGGIAGCATACYLARDGVRVRLIERAALNGLASGANAGSLHAQIPHDPFRQLGIEWARGFSPAIKLFIASLQLWQDLEKSLEADLEIGFGGGLLVAATEEERAEIAAKVTIERAAGLNVEVLDEQALRSCAPYLSSRALGGAFCAAEGKANPLLVAPAFAAAARKANAVIETTCGEASISREGSGYAVVTPEGSYRADRIVLAAGSATGTLAAMLGHRLPIEAFPIQVGVSEPAVAFLPHLLYCAGAKLTMKQTRIGSVLIGGGWSAKIDSVGRAVVDPISLAANLHVACDLVPAIGSLALIRSWAAFVNGTADWLPILGELPGAPGVFINYVPWMGFTGGPAASRGIADMVQGRNPSLPVPFSSFAPQWSSADD